jgi:hypothetical protein
LVADQEVAEEDGGWQSAINIEYQRQTQQSNQSTNANRCGETAMQSQHQELPIIDLLDINDQMEIELKSEPISPRMNEFDSCLLSNQTNEERANLVSMTRDEDRDDAGSARQERQQPHQISERSSSNDDAAAAELRWLRPRNDPLQIKHQDTLHSEQDPKQLNSTYCKYCQKNFSRAWSLQRHLADTHFYVPQSLSCDLCGRSYKSRNSLVSHKSQYHARKNRKEHNVQCEVTY